MTTTTDQSGGGAIREGGDAPMAGRRRLRVPPWHPILLAAWSVLAVWAGNIGEVPPGDAVGLLAVTVAIVVGVWIVLAVVARLVALDRSVSRAAMATSIGATAVLFAGRVASGLSPWVGLTAVAVVALVGVMAAVTASESVVAGVTTVANVFTLVATVLVGVPVVWSLSTADPRAPMANGQLESGSGQLNRDIFYIIPDRYPRADTAAQMLDFDITEFQDFLVDRGFTIQDRARANYPKTAHSLGATWNLAYVPELISEEPEDPSAMQAAYQLLPDHRLGQIVTDAGLDYVHVGSWWWPTASAASATTVFDTEVASEFSAVWATTTALRWWATSEVEEGFDDRRTKYELTLSQLAELERLARTPSNRPRLVLGHLTVPHPPFVFNADGSFVDQATARERSRAANIEQQTKFINDWFETLIDMLVTGDEATDPIIVIQSDEGPTPEGFTDDDDWRDVDAEGRKMKLRTISAWYLPGVEAQPPADITGVNTWRFILDHYLDTDFGLLEDRVFLFPTAENRYEFIEVTDDFD